jgi:hypothetical protein
MHGRLAFAGLCALFLLLPATTALAAPANDAFVQAKRLSLGTADATVSNVGATTEPGEAFTATGARPVCDTEAEDSQAGATAWWWVTGTGRPLTVTTAGSMFDTHLGVFPGPITGEGAVCQDADTGGEEITIESVAGRRYAIQVGGCVMNPLGCGLSTGQVQILATSPAPPNDLRGAAAGLVSGAPVGGDNYAATEEPDDQTRCRGRDIGRSVWYRWSGSDEGNVTFTVTGAPNAAIAAFASNNGLGLGCDADPGGDARLAMKVRAGDILLQVGGIGAHAGASDSAQSTFTVSAAFVSTGRRPGGHARGRVMARAQMAVRYNGRYTKVRRLTARSVPARARLQVRCSGRGCPFARSRTRTIRRASREVSLSSPRLRRANLRPGTKLEVRATKAGLVGLVTRWTFRARRPPLEETLCLPPGVRTPRACE